MIWEAIKNLLEVFDTNKPPQPEIVSLFNGDDVSRIVSNYDYNFYQKLDKTYVDVSLKSIKEFIQYDKISENKYVADIYDCDNFAIDLMHTMWKWAPNMAFGLCFVNRHVLNCFIANDRMYFVEPQTDIIMTELPNEYHINFLVI